MVVVMGRRCSVLGMVFVLMAARTGPAHAGLAVAEHLSRTSIGSETVAPVYNLALGDSTAMWNGNRSYPDLITNHYASSVPGLTLVDMACSGESTSTMIAHSLCAPGGSQYQNALSFLRAHTGKVALVTIDIGGNDVVNCIYAANPATCFVNGLKTMQKNLATILAGLRAATQSHVPVIGMNYYDPLLGDWLAGPGPTRTLALTAMAGLATLNHDADTVYARFKVPVVDVTGAFQSSDMTDLVSSPWGRIPVAVDRACTWLDITCRKRAVEGFGDDPNDDGAKVIAGAFENAIGTLHHPAASKSASWSFLSSPNPSTSQDLSLNGVACLTTTDCAAVGLYFSPPPTPMTRTLVEGWDGIRWSIVRSPSAKIFSQLTAMSCTAPAFCVAVGWRNGGSLIEQWNGTKWSVVDSANDPMPWCGGTACRVRQAKTASRLAPTSVVSASTPQLSTGTGHIGRWSQARTSRPPPTPGTTCWACPARPVLHVLRSAASAVRRAVRSPNNGTASNGRSCPTPRGPRSEVRFAR